MSNASFFPDGEEYPMSYRNITVKIYIENGESVTEYTGIASSMNLNRDVMPIYSMGNSAPISMHGFSPVHFEVTGTLMETKTTKDIPKDIEKVKTRWDKLLEEMD